jgi:glycosyltransferase 2 family protein
MIKNWKIWIKVAVSITILTVLLRSVELGRIYQVLSGVNLLYASSALGLIFVSVLFAAFKLTKVIQSSSIRIGWSSVTRICLISQSFNQILPGRVGGDVIRIFYLAKVENLDKLKALSAVVFDRFSNLLSMLLIGCIAAPLHFLAQHQKFIYFLWGCSLVLLILLLSHSLIFSKIESIIGKHLTGRAEFIKRLLGTAYTFNHSLKFLFLATLFQLIVILVNYCVGLALGFTLPLGYYCAFIPLLALVTLVPVSLGGLGVRELSYVFFLGLEGISTPDALGFSILIFVLLLLSSLPGLVLFTLGSEKYGEITES